MKRKQWFTQKTPPTTMGFDHLIFDGSERYLAWVGTEEDARLIAAAPELLEALQCAVDVLEDLDMNLLHNVVENGKAAIAKAFGEDAP